MCELACSSSKEGLFIPERSRIRVISDALEGWSRPAVCLQCDDPMCMAVCPVQAISKTETAEGDPFIQIEGDKCIGCRRCEKACHRGLTHSSRDSGNRNPFMRFTRVRYSLAE